jgi:hypothetical protein
MRFSRRHGVTAERSGDRAVVLDADGLVMSSLSPVGALIWDFLPSDVGPIVDHPAERFPGVARAKLTADIERFLAELVSNGLIVDAHRAV